MTQAGKLADDLLTNAFQGDVLYWVKSVAYWQQSLESDMALYIESKEDFDRERMEDTNQWLRESIRMLERSSRNLESRLEFLRAA